MSAPRRAAARPVPLRRVIPVGLAAGLLGGLFGVGGGLVIVPGLMAYAGFERRLAHGTSLAATLPIAVASLLTYLSQDNVDWALAACLTAGSIAGAIVGTRLLRVIPKRPLTLIFVATILATAFRLVIADDTVGRGELGVWGVLGLVTVGLVAGTLAGLLGIGGGVVMVPAMVVLYDVVPVVAKGSSVAVIVPTSIVGTVRNRKHANADLRVAAAVGLAGVASAVAGGLLADRIGDVVSNVMFAVLLVVVAAMQLNTLRDTSTS